MKKILILLLILCGSVSATQTEITSLGQNISSGGAADTFYLAGNLSTSGYGLIISADSVTIDLSGYDVTFNTAGSNSTNGITITGDYVNLINGRVLTGYDDTVTVHSVECVKPSNSQYTTIRGVHAIFGGYNPASDIDDAINGFNYGGSGLYMVKTVACTTTNNIVGFYRRDSWLSSSQYLDKSVNDALITDPTSEYHVWIDSCVETHARHAAVLAYPYGTSDPAGVLWVTNSNLTVDARNDGPWTGAYRYGESYGIALEHTSYFKIQDNNIQYDSNYFGGQGIFIANSGGGFDGYFSEVSGNTIRSSIGPLSTDTTSSTGHNTGIRIRFSEKINIFNNHITSISDDSALTYFRTGYATGFFIGYDNPASTPNDSIFIYNNEIHTLTYGDEAVPMSIMSNCSTCVLETYNNHFYSNGYLIQTATDGGGAWGIYMHDDTLEWEGTRTAGSYALVSGVLNNNWDANYNIFQDFYLVNGVSDTNIYFTGTAGDNEWELFRTLNITVNGSNTFPVANAICTTWNNLGAVVLIDTSDANGLFSGTARYWYEHNTATDSTNLQPFDLRIWNAAGTDSIAAYDWVMINESGSRDTTLTLSATLGTQVASQTKLQGSHIRGTR